MTDSNVLIDGLLEKVNKLQNKLKKAEQDKAYKERQLECVVLEIIEAKEIKDKLTNDIDSIKREIDIKSKENEELKIEIERNTNMLNRLESKVHSDLSDQDKKDLLLLDCLRDYGVDNWSGWDLAIESYSNKLVELGYHE